MEFITAAFWWSVFLVKISIRLTRWAAHTLSAWRGEALALFWLLTLRGAMEGFIGRLATDITLTVLIVAALVWPRTRQWLTVRAWVGISRRRIMACLAETRADTLDGALPYCVRSRVTPVGERFTLWCRVGQSAEQITGRIEELRAAAKCRDVRITRHPNKSHRVTVDVLRRDTLAQPVRPGPVPVTCDLTALPVGVTEYGEPWRLRLVGGHLLITGVTGSGKSALVQSILRQLAPAIRSGLVQVWAVDPKGGMELGPASALFTRFADDDYESMVTLLEDAVTVMRERSARLKGVTRQLVPTVADPLIVVIVDEVANLTAYMPERDLKRRAEAALALLTTQGRAPGLSVIGLLQDPRKEVLNIRNLFPIKIAFRLDEPWQVDTVLGDGAREAGAFADLIPASTPGVAYVRIDGQAGVQRVRAAWVTDADIDALAKEYPAPVDGDGLDGVAA
jgi:S-DNA-T family DNA segregation ATPase FtsK/SpoIIIE